VRVIVKKIRLYQCSVCRTKHNSAKAGRACEAKVVEPRIFRKGERVRALEHRTCGRGKNFVCKGVVKKILGPEPSDSDYESRHLGGARERLSAHVFRYIVRYRCPHCKKIKEACYYAPELRLSKGHVRLNLAAHAAQ